MPSKVTEFGGSYCYNDHSFATKANFRLSDGLKATVEHRSAGRAVAVGLSGKKWELWHDFAKKDTRMKAKGQVGGATLTVKQHVPAGKWALLPNPEFELTRSGVFGKDGKVQASYNCLNRVGQLEQTVYAGDDRQHKAWVKLNTKKGPSAGLRSKLEAGRLLHSAAVSYSHAGGRQLSVKSKLSDTKIKTTWDVDSDTLRVAAKHTPEPLSSDAARAQLTLHLSIPLTKPQDPKVVFGLKWDL